MRTFYYLHAYDLPVLCMWFAWGLCNWGCSSSSTMFSSVFFQFFCRTNSQKRKFSNVGVFFSAPLQLRNFICFPDFVPTRSSCNLQAQKQNHAQEKSFISHFSGTIRNKQKKCFSSTRECSLGASFVLAKAFMQFCLHHKHNLPKRLAKLCLTFFVPKNHGDFFSNLHWTLHKKTAPATIVFLLDIRAACKNTQKLPVDCTEFAQKTNSHRFFCLYREGRCMHNNQAVIYSCLCTTTQLLFLRVYPHNKLRTVCFRSQHSATLESFLLKGKQVFCLYSKVGMHYTEFSQNFLPVVCTEVIQKTPTNLLSFLF